MTDTSQADAPPHSNGIDVLDEERMKMRPADIDADVREMERRKRVESIMNSRLFREELERIIETQLKEGVGTTNLMQQISDMMGVTKNSGNVFKNSNCVLPINDIRGVEAMGYAKGEKILRCKLAAVFRLIDLYGWTQGVSSQITARLNQDEEHFLVNPYGVLFHEVTASSLVKVDMQGSVVEQGTTNFGVNLAGFSLHAAIHAARPDIRCIVHIHTPSVVAISTLKQGLLPISQEAAVIGEVSVHPYIGGVNDPEEKEKIARNLGPINKVLLLTNQGAVCCGETIEEAFFNVRNTVLACETQLKLISVGIDNLVLLPDEARKKLYDTARKPPVSTARPDQPSILEEKVERKWRVGGTEFEALMRMLDNAGFRTGYIYRHPLIKGDLPRPKNDVELPPAVSSLGYLLEEEELYKQGIWRKLDGRKGFDRTRWLNSPNVYQKVEILETGTPDPKKITKWVAESSPTHSSTPVKIESALQFVPKNTNPKEFKQIQQQIKDYRRADKISAGPQSHILEGVTWEEAKKMQDAGVTQTGDHVVLMGAASKGIIQRGYQHNATVYKSPYAKNPFDSVTDEELDEYKKVIEKKSKGEYDTDFSESEGLSSSNKPFEMNNIRSPTSETEEEASKDEQLQILRIETKNVPTRIHPEVVLSDDDTSVQLRKTERISVESNKSYKAIQRLHIKQLIDHTPRQDYRTCSHFGFPKGSYCIPNPTHFHIARYQEIAPRLRPILVNLGPHVQRKTNHNTESHVVNSDLSLYQKSATVSINLGNLRNISVNLSLQTLREFIYPFARALNFVNTHDLKSNNENAHINFDSKNGGDANSASTEVTVRSESQIESSMSEYEKQIMQNLHDNLICDIPRVNLNCSSDTLVLSEEDTVKRDNKEYESCTQAVFNNAANESSSLRSLHNSAHDKLATLKELSPSATFPLEEKSIQNKSLVSQDKVQDMMTNEIEEFMDASSDASSKFKFMSSSDGYTDESTTYESYGNCEADIDEKVIQMSEHIYMQVLKELKREEVGDFPESFLEDKIKHLLNNLYELYDKYFPKNSLSHDAKNELRKKVRHLTLKMFEVDPFVRSSLQFEIAEIVSNLLDMLFNRLEYTNHHETSDSSNEGILSKHSSEEFFETEEQDFKESHLTSCKKSSENFQDVVTAFKTKESKNSHSEKYWIAITKTPESTAKFSTVAPRTLTSSGKAINVDDIPLRPPSDYDNLNHLPQLYNQKTPVLADKAFNNFTCTSDEEINDTLCVKSMSDVDAPSEDDDDEFYCVEFERTELKENNSFKNNINGSILNGCAERPYLNGTIVNNDVKFLRTPETSPDYYVQTVSVCFSRNSDEASEMGTELDSDEGDWMGFEGAKF